MKTASMVLIAVLAAAPAWAQDTAGNGTVKAPAPVTGQQVYQQVCQACHMADARGGKGAGEIPALAKNARLEEPSYPVSMILQGRGAMPSLTDILKPAQIAAVVTYIRTNFGNHYKTPVKEADVKAMMGQ
jgi:mono/diheme cytochrome c family protein